MRHLLFRGGSNVVEMVGHMFHWVAQLASPNAIARCEALWFIPLEFPALMPMPEEEVCVCGTC
jgi:hypothetical protein